MSARTQALAGAAGGRLLKEATRVLAAARRPAKPLHPYGEILGGRLLRHGSATRTGAPLLDEPGAERVLVRISRAIGLPGWAPDIHGLALRVPVGQGRYADLLLASTGLGRVTRFTLTAARGWHGRPLGTLLPYRTVRGPVVLAARAVTEDRIELLWATVGGPWTSWAELIIDEPSGHDAIVSFDPLLNEAPGLRNYEWARRLREPAYRMARSSRRGDSGG